MRHVPVAHWLWAAAGRLLALTGRERPRLVRYGRRTQCWCPMPQADVIDAARVGGRDMGVWNSFQFKQLSYGVFYGKV